MILTENGVLKLMQRIKSFITAQLNTKAASVHTHNASEITDLPNANGYTKSESDSLFVNRGGGVITATSYKRDRDDSYINVYAGSDWGKGAYISLMGYNQSNEGGTVALNACSTSGAYKTLWLKPDGTATWDGKNLAMQEDVVPRSGGFVLNGSLLATQNAGYAGFGAGWGVGGTAYFYRGDYNETYRQGCIYLQPYFPDTNPQYKTMRLSPNGGLSWDGTAIQYTSDKRLKQQITQIDNALLDAWEDVTLCQFKYNDAVEQKGKDNARLHTGYVVQQIDTACKSHNVDISAYGLYCHEEYPERTEEVEVTQDDGSIKKETKVIEEASEHYSLRYTEIYAIECAYLRRENNRLKERLSKIEKLLNI